MKKLFVFLLAIALLVSLVSCARTDNEPVETIEIDLGLESVKKLLHSRSPFICFPLWWWRIKFFAIDSDMNYIKHLALRFQWKALMRKHS